MADAPEMKFDARSRAGYVYLPNHPRTAGCAAESVLTESECVWLDFDANGVLIGIEFLLPVGDG